MVLFTFFLIHYTSANDFEITRPRDQGYSFANTAVDSFLIDDSELTGPSRGDQPVLIFSDASSESNPSSRDQTWIEDIESLFMVGKPGTHCTSEKAETSLDQLLPPSRFQRRSSSSSSSTTPAQLSNRGESKPSCISPETANEHELENADPGKPPEGKPDPPNRDKAPPIVSEMILLVRMYGSISHEPHEKGCGDLLVPICAPFPPERQYPRIDKSPSELVVPARFCGWFFSYLAQSLSLFNGFMQRGNISVPDEITFQQKARLTNFIIICRVSPWPLFYPHWRSLVLWYSEVTKLGHYPWGK